ncbi:MAG: penicillin-binding protein 2 [Patescibacteria group bacterium]
MSKKDLFLEEAVLDDLAEGLEVLESPISRKAFKMVAIFFVAILAVVLGRMLFLGVWKNDFYSQRAAANAGIVKIVRAQRGIIFDRNGKPLVENVPSFRVSLNLVEFFKDAGKRDEIIGNLEKILDLPAGRIEELLKDVNLEKQNSLTVADQLSVDQIIEIKNLNSPAIEVEDDFKRDYSTVGAFSHVLGYVGSADKNDLSEDSSLAFNDIIGKSGIEAYYNNYLQGENEEIISYKNSKGEIVDSKILKEQISGDRVYLNIDADLQSYFYSQLKSTLAGLGSPAGVGIALNPQNGEVLALVNLPSFDNNKITSNDLTNSLKPLFNRAISGVYSPGSTIKPLVAYGALKENIISPDRQIFSRGYIEVPNPYFPDKPSRFPDWKAHGWVDMYSALARSSNVYFYALGGGLPDSERSLVDGSVKINGLGIAGLKKYWEKFGLGKETGIDLPFENEGFLPSAQAKEDSTGQPWRVGDTYNTSIGQGDLVITPIQLISYISAIANGGKIYQPMVMKKITSESGETIKESQPKTSYDYSSDIDIIKEIQKGMRDAVQKSYGTAYLLNDLPMAVSAKTGSAQIENNKKINAFFVGYAPSDNPQIAILILVEDASEGSLNTVPVAKNIMNWYYENRIKNN